MNKNQDWFTKLREKNAQLKGSISANTNPLPKIPVVAKYLLLMTKEK